METKTHDVEHQELTPELRESLVEQGKAGAEENRHAEAVRFNEDITRRLAFLSSLGAEERDRIFKYFDDRPVVVAPTDQRLGYQVPPGTYYYEVLRPPFTPSVMSRPYFNL